MGIGEATGASSSYRWIDSTTVQDRGENPNAPSHNTQAKKKKEKKKGKKKDIQPQLSDFSSGIDQHFIRVDPLSCIGMAIPVVA